MTTTHYGFKLFESTDKPTWLENWNQTMTDIDQALYNISTGGGDLPDLTEVVQRIQALEGRMTSAELRLNVDEGAISDLQDSVEELSELASRLSTLESTVTDNTSRISTLETDLTGVKNTDIPLLQSGISQAQAQNTAQDQQISGLDTRVQTLEHSSNNGDSLYIPYKIYNQSYVTGLPESAYTITIEAKKGDCIWLENNYWDDSYNYFNITSDTPDSYLKNKILNSNLFRDNFMGKMSKSLNSQFSITHNYALYITKDCTLTLSTNSINYRPNYVVQYRKATIKYSLVDYDSSPLNETHIFNVAPSSKHRLVNIQNSAGIEINRASYESSDYVVDTNESSDTISSNLFSVPSFDNFRSGFFFPPEIQASVTFPSNQNNELLLYEIEVNYED